MVNFIIHPGFVKTGSTFFQKNVIPKLNNFISIGKPYDDRNSLHHKIKLLFYSEQSRIVKKKLIDKIILEILLKLEKKKKKNIIFSDEAFLDSEFYYPKKNIYYLKELINNLRKKTKVNVRFILSTRNQKNLIISRFAYVHPNLKEKYSTLESYVNSNIKKNTFFFQSLKFHKFKNLIQREFNCKTNYLPLELLEDNKIKYLNLLKKIFFSNLNVGKIKFSKKNVNSQNDNFFIKKGNNWFETYLILRRMKFLIPAKHTTSLKKFISKKIKFNKSDITISHNDKTLRKINKYFLPDNKKLFQKYKINYLS